MFVYKENEDRQTEAKRQKIHRLMEGPAGSKAEYVDVEISLTREKE